MIDGNGTLYEIKPIPNRAPPPDKPLGKCKSWYKGVWATFDVYGGGWSSSDFGTGHGGVQAQIKGCSAITGWHFEHFPTPHQDGTEWYAWGRLPIGTERCVVRATESSGDFGGGCGGNG